jgi:hypothetical protein
MIPCINHPDRRAVCRNLCRPCYTTARNRKELHLHARMTHRIPPPRSNGVESRKWFDAYLDRCKAGDIAVECVKWPFYIREGYPVFGRRLVTRLIHEALTGQQLTPDIVMRHKCDHTWCINPAHLEPGTQTDNMRDMNDRGRHHTVLTVRDVRGIKSLLAKYGREQGVLTFIARAYRVGTGVVHHIKTGKHWRQVA